MRIFFQETKYNQLSEEIRDLFFLEPLEDALEEADITEEEVKRYSGAESLEYARATLEVALCHIDLQRYVESEKNARKAIFRFKRILGKDSPETAENINSIAEAYLSRGQVDLAEPYCVDALSIFGDAGLGSELGFPLALRNMGVVYMENNNFSKAEELFSRSMEIRQRVVGPRHEDICQSFEDVTALNQRRHSHEEAVITAECVSNMRSFLFKEDSEEVIDGLFFLGDAYLKAGYGENARDTLSKAYGIARKRYGSDDRTTIDIRLRLARVLELLQEYKDSEFHHINGIKALRRVLAGDHRLLMKPFTDLGNFYKARGDYKNAEAQFKEAFKVAGLTKLIDDSSPIIAEAEKSFDDEYDENDAWYSLYTTAAESVIYFTDSALALMTLWTETGNKKDRAILLSHLKKIAGEYLDKSNESYLVCNYLVAEGDKLAGSYDDSFERLINIYEICEDRYGEKSIEVATALCYTATTLSLAQKYDEATPLFDDLIDRKKNFELPQPPFTAKKRVCSSHPNFNFQVDSAMAQNYIQLGEGKKAVELLENLIKDVEDYVIYRVVNEADLHHDLGRAYVLAANYTKADEEFGEALFFRMARLGPNNLRVADTLHEMGRLFATLKRAGEAEDSLIRAFSIREKILPPDHPNLEQSVSTLGLFYYGERRFSDAKTFLEMALEMRNRREGEGHPSMPSAINRLAFCLASDGETEEAEKLFLRSLAILKKEYGAGHERTLTQIKSMISFYQTFCRSFDARKKAEEYEKMLGV